MLRKIFFTVLLAALGIGLTASSALAQDTTAKGAISGIVVDSSDSAIPGAVVNLAGPTGSKSAITNDQGNFTFLTLTPGVYDVRVQKTGFKVAEVKGVDVQVNRTSSVRLILEVGNVSETVEVSESAVSVDTSSTAVSSNISETLYQNIPLGRDISATFYLAPGAVSGLGTGVSNPSISGGSGLENQYVADGVSLNDPAFGGLGVFSRSYGALGSGINMSFVEEVQVKTAGFEPQYGQSTGGVVQIVTKSGSKDYHGVIGGFVAPSAFSGGFVNADDFRPLNLVGRQLPITRYEGDGELGGPVPFFKKHLFFFGAFNPTYTHDYLAPASNSGLFALYPEIDRQTNTLDYAGKLTFRINDSHSVESSIFGDPTHTNHSLWGGSLAAANTLGYSALDYGTRSWATRYNGTLSPTWLVDVSFNWNWNRFNENASSNVSQIVDQTQTAGLPGQAGQFVAQGLGFSEPYDANTKSIAVDTSKQVHFLGHHTFSLGYLHQAPHYNDIISYTGGFFTVPATNATGGDPGSGVAAGQQSNAAFELQLAANVPGGSGCTLCPLMNVPGYATPQAVVLDQVRGRFDGGITASHGLYQAGYVNDSWQMSRNITIGMGARWEQQRMDGNSAHAFFGNMWSPRIGITVDPKGDRKSKIYANFGRYAYSLPLDLAVRELSNEEDFDNAYWAPQSDASGNVVLNSAGTVNFVGDADHLLNKATGGIPLGVNVGVVSGGEPFVPGIRMEYNDELTVGAEHEFRGGIVLSARYIDRRLKRVVEDEVGQSVEQLTALAFNGGSYSYVIGNPSKKQDIFVNPNEITWAPGAATPAGCFDSNGNETPFVAPDMQNTFGTIVGSACFPSTNLNPWTDSSGNVLAGALFGGEYQPDGKPDGYADPHRVYQAVEIEVNKAFSHNWQLFANWRIARLFGNYEGTFRNDNGQSDPGISSLYDLTVGDLGLLGQQQADGYLNTDRRHVINVYASYAVDRTFLKGLVLGTGIRAQSGIPLTTLAAQEIYGNQGEVPLFGRGDLGRSPFTGTVDAHVEYPFRISEKLKLKVGMDLFNIADCRRSILTNQFVDLGFGQPNKDFQLPVTFVAPFSARMSVRLVF
jgi:hypothetical protein